MIAALHQRAGFGGQYQELGGADAGAVVDILLTKSGALSSRRARGAHQVDGVTRDAFADRHHADQLLEVQDLLGVGHRVGMRRWWSTVVRSTTFNSSSAVR